MNEMLFFIERLDSKPFSISTSKQLIKNTKKFLKIKYFTFFKLKKSYYTYYGWGKKKSGEKAINLSRKYNTSFVLLEDGFIRSLNLGVTDSPSFSIIEDNIGIYYDATRPSKLENILNTYMFKKDKLLMKTAVKAIDLIKKYNISKYNNSPDIEENFFKNDENLKVLIVTQTAGDASLKYGLAEKFSTQEMIEDAIKDNPHSSVYIKIHPDVLAGKKEADISMAEIPKECSIIKESVNPISLLKHFDKVYTKTSGMGMEALILGLEVVCYGLPYYAGWGLTTDKQVCSRRNRRLSLEELFSGAYILYTRYYNPYKEQKSDIIDSIQTIIQYRDLNSKNNGNLYFFGFSHWKRKNTLPFFSALHSNKIIFCSNLKEAKKKGLNQESKIYIWGKKEFPQVEVYAENENIDLFRVEDGFIRSVSLGSDWTKAYSLVVDSRGIYFDPRQESDLEYILNTYTFDKSLLNRSEKLQKYLIENRISKYNMYQDKKVDLPKLKEGQKIVMIPGQVEDDASIRYGAKGMTNLQLLQETRDNAPDAYIIYKPHPDVLAGNRIGAVSKEIALKYCNTVITEVSLDSVLDLVEEVHTMTSLVGLEALIRGKKVYTYGLPFYAGWGLTVDKIHLKRRKIKHTLNTLIAGIFIVYPRYINIKSDELCEVEILCEGIEREKKRYNSSRFYKQFVDFRNMIFRKIQLLFKIIRTIKN